MLFRIYVQAMSLTMLKNNHGSKCYLELSSKAFSSCGQNLCKSCHSTPFRCSILSVEFNIKQDACTGVHSAYRREKNGHNLDICVLRRLRLTQRQMQEFLGLKLGGGLHLQIWDLNRAHETERTVFPIPQVFSMCRRRL